MSRLLPLLLAAFSLGASACYSERLPPPTFRHSCAQDQECGDGESCISGLCQVECTLATAADDCGSPGMGSTYFGCLNGVCSSICNPDDDVCPGSQTCATIPGAEDFGGACVESCTEGSCPAGEVCVELPEEFGPVNFCATACDPGDPASCAEGETCIFGVCSPDDVIESGGDDSAETSPTDTDGDTDGGATE
ncbi:MAG: hypothetical protein ACE37F_36225 [Nannocystaceae bacterium]|nr:hypothetical protein [bacterium]